jgi:hypothetical protein
VHKSQYYFFSTESTSLSHTNPRNLGFVPTEWVRDISRMVRTFLITIGLSLQLCLFTVTILKFSLCATLKHFMQTISNDEINYVIWNCHGDIAGGLCLPRCGTLSNVNSNRRFEKTWCLRLDDESFKNYQSWHFRISIFDTPFILIAYIGAQNFEIRFKWNVMTKQI